MLKAILVAMALLCSSAAMAEIDYTAVDPVVELRGIWIDAGAIPHTDREIRQMVRSYAKANFNVLLPETICRGYAVYHSALIGRDPRFENAVDPLPVMISEAHKLGMEVHPWVWVFRAGYTRDKGSILTSHPDWADLDANGKDLSGNGGYWISPAVPEARDFLANLYMELITNYDVDGIHLDYIRYETEEKGIYGYSQQNRALFEKQYGVDPAQIRPGSVEETFWDTSRERLVNTFVQRIALQTRSLRPHVKISAAVAPYPPDARSQLRQNWPNWVANKWVDFVTPMAYTTDDGWFGRVIFRQREAVRDTTILAAGLGIMMHKDPSQTVSQIGAARKAGALGQVAFSASYVKPKQLEALSSTAYSQKALLPFRDSKNVTRDLMNLSVKCRKSGQPELADYYGAVSDRLDSYCAYQETHISYIPPAPPPPAP